MRARDAWSGQDEEREEIYCKRCDEFWVWGVTNCKCQRERLKRAHDKEIFDALVDRLGKALEKF